MAYSYTVQKHAVCFPTKIAQSAGSPHIYNIKLSTAADNGNIIGRGAWEDFDRYAEAAAPNGFAGKIVAQAANGNWYVEVTALGSAEALLVYNSPILPFESPRDLADLSTFYNAAGDTVKAYTLIVGDIFEVSAEAFTGVPVANKAVSVASKKLVVAS